MQKHFEEQYHKLESSHWWFVGRRQAVRDIVQDANVPRECSILEIGCSGGPLMQELICDGYPNIIGIDISTDAVECCRRAGLDAQIMDAQKLSFPSSSINVITASDVLEHLENDQVALSEWYRVLTPGGLLIVFVPAFKFLWSEHDVMNRHYRRYTRNELIQKLKNAGFHVERSSYWNVALFPAVTIIRLLKELVRGGNSPAERSGDLFMPPYFLNVSLLSILRLENWAFRRNINWPIGISTMVLASRPRADINP